MVRIKICGITNIEDARDAVECGADAIGFVFHKRSPRAVKPETVRMIIELLPPFISTVGVFVDENRSVIEEIMKVTSLDLIQLHGSEPPDACHLSRKVVKAIRVNDISDLRPMTKYRVSAFLLDTFSPHEAGGTGRIFNWDIAVEAKNFGRIILAGGLTPHNVAEAIRSVQPYGIDVSTGVEGEMKGKKDRTKLRQFIETARNASQGLS